MINGGFDIWQRGTSFSLNTTSVTYTADRWAYYSPGGGTGVVSKEEAVVDGTMRNTLKAVFSNITNSHRTIRQRLENSKRFSNKTVTLSFWAKSNTAQGYNILWRTWYTGSTYDDYTSGAIQLGTSWKYYSVTFKFPDISNKSFNNDNEMELMLQNVEVKDHELHLSDVQLEFGKVATPFEHRSYGEELALCQRYFEKIEYDTSTDSGGGAAAETLIANGFAYTTTRSLNHLKFNVIKRTQPTVTIVGGVAKIEVLDTTGGWVTTTAFTARANIHGTRLDLTHPSSLTAGNALEVRILSGGYLNIDAEL